jgi:hypothetical protein
MFPLLRSPFDGDSVVNIRVSIHGWRLALPGGTRFPPSNMQVVRLIKRQWSVVESYDCLTTPIHRRSEVGTLEISACSVGASETAGATARPDFTASRRATYTPPTRCRAAAYRGRLKNRRANPDHSGSTRRWMTPSPPHIQHHRCDGPTDKPDPHRDPQPARDQHPQRNGDSEDRQPDLPRSPASWRPGPPGERRYLAPSPRQTINQILVTGAP